MAVATRRLAGGGLPARGHARLPRPSPTRRRSGTWGADHLARHELDAVRADYVITESGGIPVTGGDGGLRLPVLVGEKGSCWCTLRVTGTPGHASQPYATDNALVTAARGRTAAGRLPARDAASTTPGDGSSTAWPTRRTSCGPLLDPDRLVDALGRLPGGDGAPVPRLHAHDHRPHGGPRRDQDQRDPRPGRPRSSTSARCPGSRCPTCEAAARRGARRPRRPRRADRGPTTTPSTESPVDTAAVGHPGPRPRRPSTTAATWCR